MALTSLKGNALKAKHNESINTENIKQEYSKATTKTVTVLVL